MKALDFTSPGGSLPENLILTYCANRWPTASSWWDKIHSHQEQQYSLPLSLPSSPKICTSSLSPSTTQSSTEVSWTSPTHAHNSPLHPLAFLDPHPLCPYWLPSALNTSLHTLVEYFASLSQNSILLLGEVEVNVASRTEKPWVGPGTTWGIVSFSEECDLKSPIQPTNHLLKRLQ